ncbi:hypothetical protein KQX54_015390 [Cotesia glomerata]|uniref:Uncharacterized protein n=1 Tax=Cotesia glomerata TaxID=32391 RepID=A0AAV7I8W9_COTGL|nr:hypothetical protein KQX54_015390 [Cotesia glomerata]
MTRQLSIENAAALLSILGNILVTPVITANQNQALSGLIYRKKFYIIEYYQCEINGSKIEYSTTIVTKLPLYIDPTTDSRYKTFKRVYGVKLSAGFIKVDQFRRKLTKLIPKMDTVYLRNEYYHQLFIEFLRKNFSNIEYLEDLGYLKDPVVFTTCPYHENPGKNYCATMNAIEMALWLVNTYDVEIESLKMAKRVQLVIHFNGYYSSKEYFFKELSIYGLDSRGVIVYHQWFVAKPAKVAVDKMAEVWAAYDVNVYDKYGIKWYDGFVSASKIKDTFFRILSYSNSETVYVNSLHEKNIFKTFNEFPVEVVCLNDFGYVHKMPAKPTKCKYHIHTNMTKNVCIDDLSVDMVAFVQKNGLLNPDIRFEIKKFRSLSQLIVGTTK